MGVCYKVMKKKKLKRKLKKVMKKLKWYRKRWVSDMVTNNMREMTKW